MITVIRSLHPINSFRFHIILISILDQSPSYPTPAYFPFPNLPHSCLRTYFTVRTNMPSSTPSFGSEGQTAVSPQETEPPFILVTSLNVWPTYLYFHLDIQPFRHPCRAYTTIHILHISYSDPLYALNSLLFSPRCPFIHRSSHSIKENIEKPRGHYIPLP